MNLQQLLSNYIKDFKRTENYENLSPSEKKEMDKLLISAIEAATSSRLLTLYQLKISLKGIRPPIWRRILVPSNITFHQLHDIIQTTMGWGNYHLYSFEINDFLIEIPDEEQDFGFFFPTFRETADSRRERLRNWLDEENQKITYTYDFGDNWEHTITVEKIEQAEENLKHPICLKGKRACPPEDVGGVYSYLSIIDALKKNSKESTNTEIDEYEEELLEWYGDFDPEAFDLEEINKALKKIKFV
ncbi:plasmid pRiA4b ORF-3 family protein [Bacillus methanolicus PB1]|uniref:Plasmid pRiA4b ORF-3 family protein n=1 Tax=Bacillus methanolicus PB1 TaxID=997296 RepID=I3E1U0_BACMT|nr:plasmid pRiA4b ORF-3 family protein [Bacillus methanolicus]EIJ80461.1 plasmid pRiA4b ORF-3 family protein [Bacillus methanolicus PB1]